ncbi:hypothetical protein CsatB_028383 [Cannabis sativa]
MAIATAITQVVIREVWRENLLEEFQLIGKLIHDRYRYISFDTEFPGCVFRPPTIPNRHYKIHPIDQYRLIKQNVDILNLIQLGLTLTDSDGNFPDLGGQTSVVWQFNFCDFDINRHRCALDSIDLLKKQGIDFERNLTHGINSAHFANLMYHYRLVFNRDITWITFHSAYDFGYLVKILTGCFLPHFLPDFLYLVSHFFGQNVYDMKYMMGFFPGLYGGLESLASTLQIVREVGLSHQAGSDSLLTWRTFQKMRLTCFDSDQKELRNLVKKLPKTSKTKGSDPDVIDDSEASFMELLSSVGEEVPDYKREKKFGDKSGGVIVTFPSKTKKAKSQSTGFVLSLSPQVEVGIGGVISGQSISRYSFCVEYFSNYNIHFWF